MKTKPQPELDETLERLTERVAKGAGVTFIGKVIGTGLKYTTQVVMARLLGARVFGLYALGKVIYHLGQLISEMGLYAGAVRYVSIYHGVGDMRRLKGVLLQAVGLSFFGGLGLGAVLFLNSGPIAQEFFSKPELASALWIFAMALPFGASMTVAAVATTGFKTTKYLIYVQELVQPFTNLLLFALLFSFGLKLSGAVAAWLLASILGLAAALYFVRKIFPAVTLKEIKPIFKGKQLFNFSIPLAFGDFLEYILLWTDTLMLGYFRSAAEVGIYRAASQTALLLTISLVSLDTIFAPMIADLYNRRKFDKMGQLFKTTTRWSFTLTLPLFLVVGMAGQDILRIFGQAFAVAWLPLLVLDLGQLVNTGTGGVGYMLVMSGHQYLKLLGDLALATTNIVLNLVLIPRWGLLGAAAATGISIAGMNLLRMVQVYVTLGVQAYDRSYLKVVAAGVLAALSGLGVHYWLPPVHFPFLAIITTGVVLSVYTISLWRMGFEEADKIILEKIRKRLSLSKR